MNYKCAASPLELRYKHRIDWQFKYAASDMTTNIHGWRKAVTVQNLNRYEQVAFDKPNQLWSTSLKTRFIIPAEVFYIVLYKIRVKLYLTTWIMFVLTQFVAHCIKEHLISNLSNIKTCLIKNSKYSLVLLLHQIADYFVVEIINLKDKLKKFLQKYYYIYKKNTIIKGRNSLVKS